VRGSGLETHLVRWERVGDHLVLSKENLAFRADPVFVDSRSGKQRVYLLRHLLI